MYFLFDFFEQITVNFEALKSLMKLNTDPRRQAILSWSILIGHALIWGTSFILIKKSPVYFSTDQVGSFSKKRFSSSGKTSGVNS